MCSRLYRCSGSEVLNHLGFIAGVNERQILLDENDYLYTANFKGYHFQGELRNDKFVAEYFLLFKYIHHDQVCDEPYQNDGEAPVYLPIKLKRCKNMFAVSSDQTKLGNPAINPVNPFLETFPYFGEEGDAYTFPLEGKTNIQTLIS